jgi:bifunctional DNA primase/polymerase-like protein
MAQKEKPPARRPGKGQRMKASKPEAGSNTNTSGLDTQDRPGTDKPRAAVLHEMATQYIERGLSVVPLTALDKKPRIKDWQKKNFTPDSFQGDDNIGVKLGEASRNLVDIDLDVPETRVLAAEFFGNYPAFGRHSAPCSHRLFRHAGHPKRTERLALSNTKLAEELLGLKPGTEDKTVFLELRCTGQTMFPPSIHPSGETVEWHNRLPDIIPNIPPESLSWDELRRNAGILAFLALVLRVYPRQQGNRDNICMALSGALIGLGLGDEDVNSLVGAVARAAGDEEAKTRGKAQQTRAKMDAGDATTGLPALLNELGIEGFEKDVRKWLGLRDDAVPEGAILMQDGDLVNIVDRAQASLLAAGLPIYQRGELVRATRLLTPTSEDDGGIQRHAGSMVLLAVDDALLVEWMAKSAQWFRITEKGPRPADPAGKYARHLLARKGEWKFPPLRGVLTAPTLARNGRIIEEPGYDAASGLLLDIAPGSFPPIPLEPTKAEAKAALEKLAHPLRDFPFVSDAAKSVALSAMLTALVRPSMRTAPLHAFDAPTAGTGKGKLAEMPCLLVSGVKPPAMSQGKSPEEDEKRLSTVLRAGDPVILIDNCDVPLQGDFLCSMLTQEVVQARILGLSERVVLPSTAFVEATGNNLVIAGDMTRRSVLCRMDAGCERPDEREFSFDCQEELMAARPEFVVAGLTALRAYVLAKKKPKLRPMGSFEDWDWIRGTLVWLDYADPADTRAEITANDPKKNELIEVMDAWDAVYADRSVSVAEIDNDGTNGPIASAATRLHHLLLEATGKREWSGKSVGWWLRNRKDRVVAGRCFKCREERGQQSWQLMAAEKKQAAF